MKKICRGGVLVPQCREEQGGEVGTAQSTNWRNGRDLDPGLTPLRENSQGPSAAFSPLDVLSLGQEETTGVDQRPRAECPIHPLLSPEKRRIGSKAVAVALSLLQLLLSHQPGSSVPMARKSFSPPSTPSFGHDFRVFP